MTEEPTLSLVKLSELQANPRNPKKHANETIGASIDRFGMIEPVIVDQRTGYLISGHGRTETLRMMKARGEAPPDWVKVHDDDWLVPTVTSWSSRSDAEADAALVALNRTGEIGGWDPRQLADILQSLSANDALDGVGYGKNDLDLLLRTLEADDQFNQDFENVIDEFLDMTGTGDQDFTKNAFRVLRVVFPDEAGARKFFDTLGVAYDATCRSIAWPYAPARHDAEVFDA